MKEDNGVLIKTGHELRFGQWMPEKKYMKSKWVSVVSLKNKIEKQKENINNDYSIKWNADYEAALNWVLSLLEGE